MAAKKLNVLVYTGTGTTLNSVRQCIYTLRRLLSPNYAVIPLTESALLKEPWSPTCALLVFPGGADLGYCRVLNGAGNRVISNYVRFAGGRFLGFCAGGYYGSRRCEFEVGNPAMEVVGSRELAFFPGTCRGGAFEGFEYGSERGARAVKVVTQPGAFGPSLANLPDDFRCYYNGGGVFVDAAKLAADGIEVLAEYADHLDVEPGETNAAVIYCKAGQGAALLTGPHPEFAAANLDRQKYVPGYDSLIDMLAADDQPRTSFLKACLSKLGLDVSEKDFPVPSLSKLHLSAAAPGDVTALVHQLADIVTKEQDEEFIRGQHDTFHLEKPDSRWSMTGLADALDPESHGKRPQPDDAIVDHSKVIKRIVSHEHAWPEPKETPYFNHALFYNSLLDYRKVDRQAVRWGDILMYGEVVTSTNTLIDQNPSLLAKLPTGFTLTATTQVAGRGRGSNVWVSPAGSLIMSTVINHAAHLGTSRPIVFIQYLAAVAIVEAVQSYGPGYEELEVRLKWPNDVYALDPTAAGSDKKYAKIGGILSNCAYSDGQYQVVLGIGINTTNARPTTSLNALVDKINAGRKGAPLAHFSIERLLARVLTRLETLYEDFCRTGFSAELEQRYYRNWLHTNQIVTLEAEGGVKARVLGITRDWGMLKAEELRDDGINGALRTTGKVWALQSDENSFDFWKGLVKRKM